MNLTRDRVRSIGWALTFAICLALLAGLTLRVNAVKSQVLLTERKIVAVERDKLSLETEFQTRANQQQLTAINEVEFGYTAPGAGQYVEGERQLAALARPAMPAEALPAASAPVLMASADQAAPRLATAAVRSAPAKGSFPALVAPLAGTSLAAVPETRLLRGRDAGAAAAPTRIALSDIAEGARRADKPAARAGIKAAPAPAAAAALAKPRLAHGDTAKSSTSRPAPPARPVKVASE